MKGAGGGGGGGGREVQEEGDAIETTLRPEEHSYHSIAGRGTRKDVGTGWCS